MSVLNRLALVLIVTSAVVQCCSALPFYSGNTCKSSCFLVFFSVICFPLLLVSHGSGAISEPVMCLKKLMGSPVHNVDIIFVKSRAELMDKSTSAVPPPR